MFYKKPFLITALWFSAPVCLTWHFFKIMLLDLFLMLCMWVFYLRVYMYTICMCGCHGGLKRVSSPLGLELTNGCEPPGGCWESTWVLGTSANTLNHWAISPVYSMVSEKDRTMTSMVTPARNRSKWKVKAGELQKSEASLQYISKTVPSTEEDINYHFKKALGHWFCIRSLIVVYKCGSPLMYHLSRMWCWEMLLFPTGHECWGFPER